MNKEISRTSAILLFLTAVLVSCGGGDDKPCASNVSGALPVGIYFKGLNINNTGVTFKVNEPAALNTDVVPAECRGSMTFAVKSGSIPPGMRLEDGNVIGVPSASGQYRLQLMITEIKGYSMTGGDKPSTLVADIKIQ